MRQVLVAAAMFAGLAVPSTAAAQAGPPCLPSTGPYEYQTALTPFLGGMIDASGPVTPGGGAQAAARQGLGAQFTGLSLDPARQGWTVAFAPGPLDATAARAAIVARLADQFTPDQVAFLDSKLNVIPDTYSEADLEAVRQQIIPIVQASGWNFGFGIGCAGTGFWRVEITRFGVESTPEVLAETQALFAPFGDRVHLSYVTGVPVPTALGVGTAPPAKVRLGDFVSRPSAARCLRGGKVSVKAKTGVKALGLTAGRRHATATAGKTARLALEQRSTRMTIKVTLKDGRSASQQVTYKRCG